LNGIEWSKAEGSYLERVKQKVRGKKKLNARKKSLKYLNTMKNKAIRSKMEMKQSYFHRWSTTSKDNL
jgi:hypothetical protein